MGAVLPYDFHAAHTKSQLFHSRLDGLPSDDNWRAVCETTPGMIEGVWFPGPNSCDDWVRLSFSNWVHPLMELSDRVRTASGVSGLRRAGHVDALKEWSRNPTLEAHLMLWSKQLLYPPPIHRLQFFSLVLSCLAQYEWIHSLIPPIVYPTV